MKQLLLLLLLVACSSADEPAPPPVPIAVAPANPPAGLLVTTDLGPGALQKLSEAIESPMLRALLPASPSELVRRIDERPRNVDERAAVRVALVGEWSAPDVAIAFGSSGRRHVVASDAELLGSARWMTAPVEVETIEARFEDDSMGRLRIALDRLLEDQVRTARAGIALEESRHDEPPAFGDPRALVEWAAQRIASYVAFVPDLRDTEIEVELEPLLVRGAMRADDGSAAARALDTEQIEAAPRVPAGTAVGWWRASPRPGWMQLLETSAGSRLSQGDLEIVRALGEQPADGLLVALGHDESPFVHVSAPRSVRSLDSFFAVAHVRTLLGSFRCDRVRRVTLGSRLCAEGPFVRLATTATTSSFSIADRAQFEPRIASSEAMGVLPVSASGIVLLDPGRMAPATGLWRRDAPASPSRETPLALSWKSFERSLSFEVRFAPGSLTALSDAGMAATDP